MCIRFVAIAALLLVSPALVGAQEHAPRVVSEHTADVYSLKTLAEFPRWRALTGDARTWEIYKYFADPRTGLYPLGTDVREGREMMSEFALVRDPIKIINVYGYGFCGILGPVVAAVFDMTGMGRSRTLDIPIQAHVAAETFYDGKWHFLDLDRRTVFRRPDGSLASMADARSDASLWIRPGPLFFPSDPIDSTRDAYRDTVLGHMYDVAPGGHTMDYLLRQGETFTRWWAPQGGRWSHLDIYNQSGFHRQLFEREPRGPKSKHSDWTVQNHGNGRFVYKPDLTERSSDFERGLHDAVNVQPAASGLTLSKAGEGFAVFEVRSPYIIVPLVGNVDSRDDDREASVVEIDATNAALSISLDNGVTWKALETNPSGTDLTRLVSGTYGYLLKITLKGEPGAAVVRALTLTTWVQVAPASLPSLRRGKNRMEYRTGDHYGLQSRVQEIAPSAADRAEFFKYLSEPPQDFDPARQTARAKGRFVVKVDAPPHHKIAWFSAGASFATYQLDAARNTRNSIAYAANEPKDFVSVYQADVPEDQGHWHYNADREVKLDVPAKTVYVQYVGDPGVNNIRIYAHSVADNPVPATPVTITHIWTENGAIRSRTVTMAKPGPYEIETGAAEPVDQSVEIAVPSVERPR